MASESANRLHCNSIKTPFMPPDQNTNEHQQDNSPVHPSQASTVPCTPQVWQKAPLLPILEGSTGLIKSPSALKIFAPSTNRGASLLQGGGVSQISLPGGSLPKNGPITISQLIPSSLIGSDVPLPPAWSQRDDELEL
jgi:hypothetical protein